MALTKREQEILELIKEQPTISRTEIASELEISASAVGTHLHNLMQKGYLLGKGYIVAPQQKVVVIGGSNLDLKGYAQGEYLPETSNRGQLIESLGGVARNIAENLGILEQPTILLSAVGKDNYGKKLIKETEKPNLNLDYLYRSADYRTGIYLAHLDSAGDLLGAIADMEILEAIDKNYLQQYRQLIATSARLVIDTNLKETAIDYLLDLGEKEEIPVVAESVSVSKSRKLKGKLAKIDILTPNLEEIMEIFALDSETKSLDAKLELVKQAYKQRDLETVLVISLGQKGVYILGPTTERLLTAPKLAETELVETTGAGDALTAGLIYGLQQDKSLPQAVNLGIEAAQITIKSRRTVNLDLKEELNLV